MADLDPLPLFPLHTVLFPGAPLPLHVFESRYRLMVARCLEADAPFGVVLIREGRDVGDPAVPYQVGTRARIAHHETLEDGRSNVVALGLDRFRVDELRHDEPYLTARVTPITEAPTEPAAARLATRARAALEQFGATSRVHAELRLPDEPTAFSFALAAGLPLPLAESQALLELTSTAGRLERLLAILERERQLRHRVGFNRPAVPGHIGQLSPN